MTTFQNQIVRHWPLVRSSLAAFADSLARGSRVAADGSLQVVSALARQARNARQLRLFLIELVGVVLVTFAISFWSVPSAIVIGGLVLVAAAEVRPHVGAPLPPLPVPEALLRAQAEQAARLLNNARFGVAEVDGQALDKLSRDDCERIITLAHELAAKP